MKLQVKLHISNTKHGTGQLWNELMFQQEIRQFFLFKACLKAPVLETWKNFKKIPVLGIPVLEDFEILWKNPCGGDIPPCVWAPVPDDFEIFSSVCAPLTRRL